MKALVYTGPEQLALSEVPVPQPGAGEVLVKVHAVGICGSDMHAWLGHDERRPPPLILGHEVAGEVASGADAGRRVTVNPLVTCMVCEYCLAGQTNLCLERQIISMPPRPGGFADYLVIPKENLVTVPDGFAYRHAALAEPLAVAWHALKLAAADKPVEGMRLLILGGGAIGLACALVGLHFGASEIFIAEPNTLRHEVLASAGDFTVFQPDAPEAPAPSSFDRVIDAFGGPATQKAACKYIKPGGIIVNVGLAGGGSGLDIRRMTLQDIRFTGSYTYTREDFGQTANALFTGQLGGLDWIHSGELGQGSELFRQIQGGEVRAPKVVLLPHG